MPAAACVQGDESVTDDPTTLTATAAAALIANGDLSSEALVGACLARIEAREPAVAAWSHVDPCLALEQARACDRIAPIGPLHGVPVGIKDIVDTRDQPTTYGSRACAGFIPAEDAACVAALREAGAVILGKTVTTEFANRDPGPTSHPLNRLHTPGGSSSGSAAAVADRMVPLALVFSLVIALLLNQNVKFQGVYRVIYYLPSIVSGVAVAILWKYLLQARWGLINQGLALLGIEGPKWLFSTTWAMPAFILMGVWAAGGNMLLYLAGLQGIPTDLYDAASIDGANAWHRFWKITLPMLTPTIYFNLIISIIGAWQIFTQSYIITAGGPDNSTLTMVLLLYRKGFQQFHFGYASAIAWVLFAIVMLFTVLVVRSSEAWVYYAGEVRG